MWEDIQESFPQNLTSTCGAEVASGALCMLLIAWSNQKQQNLTTDPPVISKKYFWFKMQPKTMESEPAMKKLWRCQYLGGGNSQLVLSVTKKNSPGSNTFKLFLTWKKLETLNLSSFVGSLKNKNADLSGSQEIFKTFTCAKWSANPPEELWCPFWQMVHHSKGLLKILS